MRSVHALVLVLVLVLDPALASPPPDKFPDHKRALEAALAARDEAAVRLALGDIAGDDSERAVRTLAAAALHGMGLDIYADLVQAVASVRSDGAVKEAIRTAGADPEWAVRYVFADALALMNRPDARKALFLLFEDKNESVAANAMRASRGARLAAAVRPLVDVLEKLEKKREGRLHQEAARALEGITGQTFTSAGDWRRWWEANEKAFDPEATAKKRAAGEDTNTVLRRVAERGDSEAIEKLVEGDIFVVGGESDTCEDVLRALKLPFTPVRRGQAAASLQGLPATAVLVFNCEGTDGAALRGPDAGLLAEFVGRGGYLFTSDWGLIEEIQPAFPGTHTIGPMMPEDPFPVKIGPVRGAEKHPYLRDVFPENPFERARMSWTIDDSAYAIKVAKAVPLVESADLGQKFGAPVVAATFRHGQGAVLHVMGHFKMQKDEKGDGYALQQLLVNFIVEKQKSRRMGRK